MKIGFVSLAHLSDWTGITRLTDRNAQAMAGRGHRITIISEAAKASTKTPVSQLAYPHELITVDLKSTQGLKAAREKITASGLDVCSAAFGDKQMIYMPHLFRGSGIPLIIGEHADPRVFSYARWSPYEHYGSLAFADALHILLADYLPYYPGPLREKAHVIGNPAPPPAAVDFGARRSKTERCIIGVGRLNEEDKRFSMLLRAFALLAADFPAWRLRLVGDGPYHDFYHVMAGQLGIKERVDFTGAVADVDAQYNDADIFCLPSFFAEGLPMTFLEASAHALPLVGYSSCVASKALIGPGMGALADADDAGNNTPEALADALHGLMVLSPEERERIGMHSRDSLQKHYGEQDIFDAWEKLFESVGQKGAKMENKPTPGIGPEWEGLTPDSPVWSEKTLMAAAVELANRADPAAAPEETEVDYQSENVRLRSELVTLRRDFAALEKKYATLAGQFAVLSGGRGKRR